LTKENEDVVFNSHKDTSEFIELKSNDINYNGGLYIEYTKGEFNDALFNVLQLELKLLKDTHPESQNNSANAISWDELTPENFMTNPEYAMRILRKYNPLISLERNVKLLLNAYEENPLKIVATLNKLISENTNNKYVFADQTADLNHNKKLFYTFPFYESWRLVLILGIAGLLCFLMIFVINVLRHKFITVSSILWSLPILMSPAILVALPIQSMCTSLKSFIVGPASCTQNP
jgi:hypothetical protein